MSSEFLLEIGTEELPASFVRHGLRSMKASALELVAQARLGTGSLEVHTMGTPRRLALRLRGLAPSQPDRDETIMGPPWSAAFEADGSPKKAATGFAKKHGVAVQDLRKQTTDKGDYVSVQVHEAGKATHAVLTEILPQICQRITFPKSMRWGPGEIAFGRPIHWVVSLLGSDVVGFEFAGVQAGRATRGHRFLAPEAFELDEASNYENALQRAHVLVDLKRRKDRMMEGLLAAAKSLGGVLERDSFLADECVSLVEEPFTVPGSFDPSFLELPDTVVVSVMRDHQRYFAVRAAEGGALLPS
jgi:glycyl-tRNA synthetase beta chain